MSPPPHDDFSDGTADLNPWEKRVAYPHVASEEDMRGVNLPVALRDLCSQHAIHLRRCQVQAYWAPWRCHTEKVQWEICQYKDFTRRMRKATRLRLEAERDGTGPVPRIDEKFTNFKEMHAYFKNQDMTPGKAGPYDMDDVIKGEKDGVRKTGH